MRRMVVLVNGLPAAGKSTLAPELAVALELPLLSKDVIKETHADVLGADPPPGLTQRDWNRKLGTAASETMWALLSQSTPGAVLESSWRTDVRQLVDAGLRRAGFAGAAEVWCEAPLPLLRERFAQRWSSSHAIHGAAPGDDEWAQMIAARRTARTRACSSRRYVRRDRSGERRRVVPRSRLGPVGPSHWPSLTDRRHNQVACWVV